METDLLTDRLHRLGERAPLPATTPTDDVRRGRRRLRRRRALAVAGSTAAVAALAGAGFAVTGPDPAPDRVTAPPVAEQPAPQREVRLADVVVGEVIPEGVAVTKLSDLLAMTSAIDDQLGSQGWARIAIGAAASWKASGAPDCPAGWTCEDVAVEGARRAMFATDGTVTQVVAQFASRVLILSVSTRDQASEYAYLGSDEVDPRFTIKGD